MSNEDLTTNLVYLDEGEEEGGIAHPTKDLAEALREIIHVEETPIHRPRTLDPRHWRRLGRQATANADVVHVQFEYGSFGDLQGMFLGSMFPVFASTVEVPIVSTLHNFRDRRVEMSIREPRSLLKFLAEHATWFVDRSLVNNTAFFVPLMRAEVDLLRRHGVPDDEIEHIPLVSETDPEFRDPVDCKRELGLEGHSVISAFGWVRRSKGYERVINILPQLPEDVVFLVAGGTRTDAQKRYLEELQDTVEKRGLQDQVRFTGYVGREDHPTIMNASDIMVFPYRDNRASDAVARAFSYHLPVVASNNDEFSSMESKWGCPRTVADDPELAAALTNLLTNSEQRQQLQENAAKYTEEMNWETVADRMVSIYQSVIPESG